MTTRPFIPGALAAGHMSSNGYWHPGRGDGCGKCPRPMSATGWSCWRDQRHRVAAHPTFGWPQCTDCGGAPAYHERFAMLDRQIVVTLYVPMLDARGTGMIAAGSAIVGALDAGGGIRVHYEGWVHGAAQYRDRDPRGLWEAGVEHAASRFVTGYPTTATTLLAADDLVPVGTYRPVTKQIEVTDGQPLAEWLGQA